jgi:HEAT repeat protein
MRPPPEVLPLLRPLLNEKRLAGAVLAVLAEMDARSLTAAVGDLVTLLSSDDPDVVERLAVVLGKVGKPAQPALEVALKSPSPDTRAAAARLLGQLARSGKAVRLESLAPLLTDADATVRLAAARAIPWRSEAFRERPDILLDLLGRPEAELRREAARGLWPVLGERASRTGLLAECLFDPDDEVRRQAVESLSARRDRSLPEEVQRSLQGALDDPSPLVRWAAARQLSPGNKNAAALVVDLACRGGPAARVEAVRALGNADRRLVRRLRDEVEADLRADDPDDRIEAAVALVSLDRDRVETVLPLLAGILEGWDESARVGAARALGSLRQLAKPALAALRRRVQRDHSDIVRREARAAIAAIETKG